MGKTEPYQTVAIMAADSLKRIAQLATSSLNVSALALYFPVNDGHYRRVFASPNYPDPGDDEQQLVRMLVGEDVEVVERPGGHPELGDHPWVAGEPGWRFVASAPLLPSNSEEPVGYVLVADEDDRSRGATAGERIADLAAVITERLELQLSQAEVTAEMDRMITIGILAEGVAHEINNPLSFIGGNLQYALRVLEDDFDAQKLPEPLATSIAEIHDALQDALVGSRRVRDVVQDLHRLSGEKDPDEFTIEPVSVHEPLNSSLSIARKHIEQRARLVRELDDVPPVMGNQPKLGQVFLNLLLNAAQAIPSGDVAANEVKVSTYRSGDDVVVSVSDTGSGISDEDLAHIFEPFFTTKPRNEGTGMGLAISHNIVTILSGDIEVDTRVGEGTTMRVVLPNVDKATGCL